MPLNSTKTQIFRRAITWMMGALFLLTVSRSAWANGHGWMREDQIYKEALQLCKKTPGIVPGDLLNTPIFRSIMARSGDEAFNAASLDPASLLSLYVNRGLSRAYVNLVQWPPFKLAVKDCYPHSRLKQKIFVNRLLLADVFGDEAGVAAAVGLSAGAFYLLQVVSRAAPRFALFAKRALVVGLVIYAIDLLKRAYFGPSVAEQKQMQAKMNKMILKVPRIIDKENLQLYTVTIDEMEGVLTRMSPENPFRARVARKIKELVARRAEIEKRVAAAS